MHMYRENRRAAGRSAHIFQNEWRFVFRVAMSDGRLLSVSPQDKGELDRFCSALISIRKEIEQVRHTHKPSHHLHA